MKKTFFYFSIVALYLFTTICIMMTLGTMVSSKYEVDEGYWLIDGNNNLSADQKQEKTNELDQKGRRLKIQAYTYAFFAFATFASATGLIIKRKKILGDHVSKSIVKDSIIQF